MQKRAFLRSLPGLGLLACAAPARSVPHGSDGPAVLTVSGRIGKPNRGRTDQALDQLMHKHGIAFEQARTFTHAELSALPATTIRPTLEYDGQRHTLRGPALRQILAAAGAATAAQQRLVLRALDGYAVELTLAETDKLGLIVATHMDSRALALGGLGPLWAICDADRLPGLAAKPLNERFAQCPWGVYSIHLPE